MPRRRRSEEPPGPPPKLVRAERWAGLRRGDPVEVTGTRLRSAAWTFVAHVRNSETGQEWVEVVGGRPGDRKQRSFDLSQVYPVTAKGSGGKAKPGAPSLVDAPQLPFG